MRLQRGRVQRGDKGRGRICLVVGGGGASDFAGKFAQFGLNLFLLVLGISDLPQFRPTGGIGAGCVAIGLRDFPALICLVKLNLFARSDLVRGVAFSTKIVGRLLRSKNKSH